MKKRPPSRELDDLTINNGQVWNKLHPIYKGWGGKDILKSMKELLDDDSVSGLRLYIKEYATNLATCPDDQMLESYDSSQVKIAQVFNKYAARGGANNKVGLAAMGERLSSGTDLYIEKNYPPDTDCDVQSSVTIQDPINSEQKIEVPTNRMRRGNSCVRKFVKDLPNSLIKEANLQCSLNLENVPEENKGVTFGDASSAVLGKDDYHADIRKITRGTGLRNEKEFYMISLITIGWHARFHHVRTGKPLPLVYATANGRDQHLEYDSIVFTDGVYVHEYVKLYLVVPHGECWSIKVYLLQYSEEQFIEIGNVLTRAYSNLDGYGGLIKLLDVKHEDGTQGSQIAFRFSGMIDMTDEERRALREGRLFFFECGTLASLLFGGDPPLLGDQWASISEKPGSLNKEVSDLYDKLLGFRKGADETMNHQKFLALLKEKYDSLVLGGELGGRPATLASAFAGTSPPYTRGEFNSDMESLYNTLLNEYTSDGMSNEQDFQKYLKSIYNRWGGNKSELRGAFKWMDDFNDLLHKVLTSEEDITLSTEDEEKYTSMMHTYNSIGIVVQVNASNVAEKYNEIEEILSLDVSKDTKYKRWRSLFLKLEKDEMNERYHELSGKAALLKKEHIRVIKAGMDSLLDAMGIDDGVADGNMNQDSDY